MEFTPFVGQMPNIEKINCKDCAFRDKTVVKIGNKEKAVGITRDECGMYKKPNFKPHEVLFNNKKCPMWVRDESNG